MKSACCWLVVTLSLVAATEAIKCLCDKPFCLGDTPAKEEECHARFDKDLYDKYPSQLEQIEFELSHTMHSVHVFRRMLKGEPVLTPDEARSLKTEISKDVKKFMDKSSNEEKARFFESLNEIGVNKQAISDAAKGDVKALFEMMDQALNGTYEPKHHFEYNFCIKIIDGSGITSRSCGLVGGSKIGQDMKVGCHKNPAFIAIANDYPRYCRCDTDLCNSGDVGVTEEENASSSPKLSSFLLAGSLMRVCFSVVMSQICRA